MRKLIVLLFCLFPTLAWSQQLPYPPGSAPVTISTTATIGAFSVILPAVTGRTTYLCGFIVSSAGTTTGLAAAGTITGTISGTLNFTYAFVSSGQGLLGMSLPNCIPASGQNQTITISVPAGSTGTVASLFAWGFQL
jgi:hypothetical protein